MRVVLDTSVFISAFISQDRPPYRALTLWFEKRYDLVTSAWQIEEIRRVSRYERVQPLVSSQDVGKTINALRLRARVFEDMPSVDYSPDPDDNPIIAAALAGNAAYTVSGDKADLLMLGRVLGVPIITARAKAQYIQREAKYEHQQDRCLYKESEHMPEWAEEHATDYWEAADTYERANGRLYKEVEFALPRELDQDQQIDLARAFAHELTDDENLPYTLAVHEGGGDNPHAHVLISERMNDGIERDKDRWFSRFNRDEPELGGAEKTTSLKPKDWLEQTREEWAKEVNQALEREGYDLSIDHRSLEAQGIDRVPQLHLGYALAMEERGLETERGNHFQEIERLNKDYELERSQQLEYERALEHSPERDHDHERTHDYGYDLDL